MKSKNTPKTSIVKDYNISVWGIVKSTHTKQDIEKDIAIRFSNAEFQTFRIKVTEI